jgi:acyl-[acyl-carrier-protein]-phospholipid O-acyltransferase/long-chain-fatty-acid--[acyl-carrier-protein] ligase
MVSLVAVEEAASVLWPGFTVAAVSLPDERKGERILLLTNCPQASREALIPHFQSHGLSELALPKRVLILDAVPLLGTGKTDYQAANALALRLEQESSQALIMERSTSDQVGAQACAPAQ